MAKLRVLHIACDEKFFDTVYQTFERDSRLENKALLITPSKDYELKWITRRDAVVEVWNKKQIVDFFMSGQYDVVYFYSLRPDIWPYVPFIPSNKTVIWWLFGFEVYASNYGMRPLIALDLYKAKTKEIITKIGVEYGPKKRLIRSIKKIFYQLLLPIIIKRIDYFQPIYSIEMEYMRNIKGFRAEEFYNNNSLYFTTDIIVDKPKDGYVLIGNSASDTNNHLDILNTIKGRPYSQLLIPMNYGDLDYRKRVVSYINSENIKDVIVLDKFMPKKDYFELLDKCSYYVVGVIRQQASENIYYCLSKGVKVFFYPDSVSYKFFKSRGYNVYSIDDIDDKSFSTPLSNNEIIHNQNLLQNEILYCDKIYAEVINNLVAKYSES